MDRHTKKAALVGAAGGGNYQLATQEEV